MAPAPTSNRPTRKELGDLLCATDLKTYSLLLKIIGAAGGPAEPLDTASVVKLAVYDWLTSLDAITEVDRQRVVLELMLDTFCDLFDSAQTNGSDMPRGAFALLDFRYVKPPSHDQGGFFDLQTGEWLTAMPVLPLTTLACDLSVLLLRLLARMEKVRKQESTDATATHKPDRDD